MAFNKGYVFSDGLPVPDDELKADHSNPLISSSESTNPVQTNLDRISTASSSKLNTPTSSTATSSAPTDSHALAEADHEEKGAAQMDHGQVEAKNLGWHEDPQDVPKPLVGGLPNEDLWLLVRRFNKQMYHVKAMATAPPGGLDLNIADEDEFSPDKLRANIERLYMTVIVGLIGFGKHIARLRSWREPRRTAAFCTCYFVAWALDLLMPVAFLTFIVLIAYPPSRPILFPSAPLALVNSKTGGVQSPKAGVLGSHDSVTGAPENHEGEAVEQEASNFVSSFAHIALSSATGKHEQSDPEASSLDKSVPDPTSMAVAGAEAKHSAAGGSPTKTHDKTKQPMEEAMWTKMRPIMHVVGDIADGWERFANALSPTAPFPKDAPRLKLAALLIPAVLGALLTTSSMFMKMSTFSVGLGFFGDPITWRALSWLNREFPNWQKLLELRNTILKGVPTNAQLTITLLRIGEANKAPLPPPPRSDEPPSEHPKELDHDDLTLDASQEELHEAIHADPVDADTTATEDSSTKKAKHRHGAHVLGFFKGTTKTGVEAKLGVDKVRAAVGSKHAKDHLGVLPKPEDQAPTGPVDFKARYQGKRGYVFISTTEAIPSVSFSSRSGDGLIEEAPEARKPAFSIPIRDIRELKKIGGLGWKAKLVVGWATDKQVADGLEIVDKNGVTWRMTAIQLREELFNRLVALGGQKWESF